MGPSSWRVRATAPLEVAILGDVTGQGERAAAPGPDLDRQRLQALRAAGREGDIRALAGELAAEGGADPGGRPRDEDDMPLEERHRGAADYGAWELMPASKRAHGGAIADRAGTLGTLPTNGTLPRPGMRGLT